jgi:hypothetical protein
MGTFASAGLLTLSAGGRATYHFDTTGSMAHAAFAVVERSKRQAIKPPVLQPAAPPRPPDIPPEEKDIILAAGVFLM